MGKKRTPKAILQLHGSKHAIYGRGDDLEVKPGVPECPEWLDAEARAEWGRIVNELAAVGILSVIDRGAMANLCAAWSRFHACYRVVQEEGMTTLTTKGTVQSRPEVRIMAEAQQTYRQYMVEFGLTPAARARLGAPAKSKKTSEEDRFLA